MTAADAHARLEAMVSSLPDGTIEERADKLLERVSLRVDAELLRAALVSAGARVYAGPLTGAVLEQ